MGGNFEKYLVDKDGFVDKHFTCTTLNYDIEATLKKELEEKGQPAAMGPDRSEEIFQEEWTVICNSIEELIAGKKSIINPENKNKLI